MFPQDTAKNVGDAFWDTVYNWSVRFYEGEEIDL